MFILLRRIERWLHQHVFKVGWLVTQNYQTTTILFYTFFLPGVILHEVVYYLVAGVFNVRAERDISWPDEQEIGELKLNFVKLAPRTSALRKAFITSSPLLVGLIIIWFISNNVFDITAVVERMGSGELRDIGAGMQLLLNAPLFWLWVYIIFTIANTMFPTVPKDLKGWRSVLIGLVVVSVALVAIGIGGEIFEVLRTPLRNIISVLQATFVLIMGIDVAMVLVLGLIEYTIERITGNSATFRGNRMYTMTREEAIEERQKERERELKRAEREKKRQEVRGPTTVYALSFPVPGAPGEEPVTELEALELPETEETIPEEPEKATSMPLFGGLADTSSQGEDDKDEPTEEQKKQREAIAARINLPESRSPTSTKDKAHDDDEEVRDTAEEQDATLVESDDKEPISARTSLEADKSKDVSESEARVSPEDEDKQPVVTDRSRFGTSRFSRPTPPSKEEDDDKSDEDDEQVAASTRSRFGIRPSGAKSEDEGTSDEKEIQPSRLSPSRFGRPSSEADEKDDEKPPVKSPVSRFSIRPFGQADEDEPDETIRVVGRPATPSLLDDEDEADNDKTSTPSSLGASRFGRPTTSTSKEDSEDEDDEEPVSGLRSYRRSTPITTRFGSSRPAPKPSDSRDESDTEDDTDADEITYEDVEDYTYEDDEDYIDYDDEYYVDDDD